MTIAQDL